MILEQVWKNTVINHDLVLQKGCITIYCKIHKTPVAYFYDNHIGTGGLQLSCLFRKGQKIKYETLKRE